MVFYLNYKPALITLYLVYLSINNASMNKLETSLCIPVPVLLKDTPMPMVLRRQKHAGSGSSRYSSPVALCNGVAAMLVCFLSPH